MPMKKYQANQVARLRAGNSASEPVAALVAAESRRARALTQPRSYFYFIARVVLCLFHKTLPSFGLPICYSFVL